MNETSLMIVALVAILTIFGVLVMTIAIFAPPQAEARGCLLNPGGGGALAISASLGRCLHP
jgi:hypothetical protein